MGLIASFRDQTWVNIAVRYLNGHLAGKPTPTRTPPDGDPAFAGGSPGHTERVPQRAGAGARSADGRPGRLGSEERHAALAAPGKADGFSSNWYRQGGIGLHVRQRLTGDAATPVVLLHGLAVSHRYLMPTARALEGRAVYVPDLPGFGLSDKPDEILDVGRHADVLGGWLESLDVAPVAVLGNSFGCQVAVELTCRRPDLVAALVLVGPTSDPAAATMWGQIRRFAVNLLFEDWRQAPILLADVRDAGLRRVVATLRHAVRDQIEKKLPSTRVPTLLARGARDRIVPLHWLARAAALTPDARTLVVERAAHNAVTTAGPQLAAAVDMFLKRPAAERDEPRS